MSCPFCVQKDELVFYRSSLICGLWDAFPVNPGHALLVPVRHISSWLEATAEEQFALSQAIQLACREIEERHQPQGFNIGINVGAAAGQTVEHLHVHVIPRYSGDVEDPRGGIRHVVPARGNYLRSGDHDSRPSVRLVQGEEDPLLPHLVVELATAERADLAVGFVLASGVDRLEAHFRDLLARGGRLRIVTGDYFGVTDPVALAKLLDLGAGLDLRIFETGSVAPEQRLGAPTSFHPKAYLFRRSSGAGVCFVGSSNLSDVALGHGVEWNYRVVSERDAEGFATVGEAFERLFNHPRTRPVTSDWISEYQERRPTRPISNVMAGSEEVAERSQAGLEQYDAPTPHEIQVAALEALASTRAAGNTAGLVVLATGLGKTWLSAFDSLQPEFRRVLFLAHREEILGQALHTFRRVRPLGRLGLYTGTERDTAAEVLFASVQTLSRAEHLRAFPRDRFDYIVIDEFHHASARSYRKVIDWFTPRFLLGLTATPERTDGADLLAICGDNLVYRCDLADGIRKDLLCPFDYFGVPDEVDYSNIPWRSSRFDEEALTQHVATRSRAENAHDQHRRRAGKRTLAFCVSQRHADFMAEFFTEKGLRAASVHSGPTSASRAASLERLEEGNLEIVCAVDLFNEGVDLPLIDTVMMLRPTESRLLWLQQLGRGLRKAPEKLKLTVIDYIGNHRSFLLKPQALFALPEGDRAILNLLEQLSRGEAELPPGCHVTYELEAVNILRGLLRVDRNPLDALGRHYDDFLALHGVRPTATETHHDGYLPRSARASHGSWLDYVDSRGGLTSPQRTALARHQEFLRSLETTEMTRSFKMLVVLALLNRDQFPGALAVEELGVEVTTIGRRSPAVAKELGAAISDPAALRDLLERNPIAAWVGGMGTGGVSFFTHENDRFATRLTTTDPAEREALQELVRELVEWRLAEYFDRRQNSAGENGKLRCRVSHSGGQPLLFLPDRETHPQLPEGWTSLLIDDVRHEANFVKVALNVVRLPGTEGNLLPAILRGWFGPDAGAPGTNHQVVLTKRGDEWSLVPSGHRPSGLHRWRRYAREEIPPNFGLPFSQAIWNVGFVSQPPNLFLLVTLDKSSQVQDFKYKDHFISPTLFQWESQNRTRQESAHGRLIRDHERLGTKVHLFIRKAKKVARGASAPFVYCGEVSFQGWAGDAPISVRWNLPEAVPEALRLELGVPA